MIEGTPRRSSLRAESISSWKKRSQRRCAERRAFRKRGRAKLEIGLGKGKKAYDKRATEKARDWQRDKQRIMRRGN